jgi:hypothetical protein
VQIRKCANEKIGEWANDADVQMSKLTVIVKLPI